MENVRMKRDMAFGVVAAILVILLYYYYTTEYQQKLSTGTEEPMMNKDILVIKRILQNLETRVQDSFSSKQTKTETLSNIQETLQNMKSVFNNVNKASTSLEPNEKQQQKQNQVKETYEKFDKHIRMHELESLSLDIEDLTKLPKPDAASMSERWIVVTSIFKPTKDLKILSEIPGWKMVVVGDKKSPKTWKLDGVVFLSVEDQLKSGYETVNYLKYGVYQRKNIGYLYAIHHGAKYIYDTDDDNHPYNKTVTFDEMKTPKSYLVFHDNRTHYNGFAHFGQSTLWPRGFPLDEIDKAPPKTYLKCKSTRPLVQQGVVDGDPDLDAIQRLTRKDSTTKFIVYFDISAPPVIFPRNSFGPYNSQNTFHLYDAFFSLLLPQTVTFRVNDIWRSFITQRHLWDIGGHLAYYPPNAYQDRTPHNFLQDFYEEDDLYRNTHPITKVLLKWKSEKTNMFERYFDLTKEIYKHDILGGLDVKLTRAWIRDLVRIGYIPPKLSKELMKCEKDPIEFTPKEMPTMHSRIGQKNVNVVKAALKLDKIKERVRDIE